MWSLPSEVKIFIMAFIGVIAFFFMMFKVSEMRTEHSKQCYEQTHEKSCWGLH